MSIPSIDAHLALDVGVRMAALSFTVSALEQVSVRTAAFGPTGPFSECVARIYARGVEGSRLLHGAFVAALIANVIAGFALVVVGVFTTAGAAALLLCLIGQAVVRRRRILASDGAEQMTTLIMFAALLAVIAGAGETVVRLAVWFIAGQVVLAYTSAGLAKAFSSAWRSGSAVPQILGSEAHGRADVSRLLARFPLLGRGLTWSVVVFECTFLVALVAPFSVAVAIFAIGFAFHLGCALFMGLNSFLWAFPATYLSVLFVAQQLPPVW